MRVEIPREGATVTFTRRLVRPEERPDLTFWFLSHRLRQPMKLLVFLLSMLGGGLAVASLRGHAVAGV